MNIIFKEFNKWLSENTALGKRSQNDVCSRLKRVIRILGTESIDCKTALSDLEINSKYQQLSYTVRSQLKRAVALYCKFKKNEIN